MSSGPIPMDADAPAGPLEVSAKGATATAQQSASGINVTLHPLVIMNISDQCMRTRMQGSSDHVIGALLGVQQGRDIEIFNSFELPFKLLDGLGVADEAYLAVKQEQFRQVFPTFDFLGWYSTNPDGPSKVDLDIQHQMTAHSPSPLFLHLAPSSPSTSDLPVKIYETIIDTSTGKELFVEVGYRVETGEAERIAVDHVAKAATATEGGAGNAATVHLQSLRTSISLLNARINQLHTYISAVKSGALPVDHTHLRQISSLCQRLGGVEQSRQQLRQYNDVALAEYLACITKGVGGIAELVDKFNSVNQQNIRKGRGDRWGMGAPADIPGSPGYGGVARNIMGLNAVDPSLFSRFIPGSYE
ncbi:JAB1/Mov34/MPN/PAD-1 ubiquitin protease-domain-containing protein [Gaertneriomyces semiglobifer]|nr:JAB1/Mov34/MPN/PAD-1 ubiquitin protease-domain-containing protein [Gaertneriomyces semiglobifer]